MLRNTLNKWKMRIIAIAPRIFGADTGPLKKVSANAVVKAKKALEKAIEKEQKRQELINKCFEPTIPIKPQNTQIEAQPVLTKQVKSNLEKGRTETIAQTEDAARIYGTASILQAVSPKDNEAQFVTKEETINEAKSIDEASLRASAHACVFGGRFTYSISPTSDDTDVVTNQDDLHKSLLKEVESIAVPTTAGEDKHKLDSIEEPVVSHIEITDKRPDLVAFETLLMRDPTMFSEMEKPTFRMAVPPPHLFQEPLLQAPAAPRESLRLHHHSTLSLEPLMKPRDEVEEIFIDDVPAFESNTVVIPKDKSASTESSTKFFNLATFSEASKCKVNAKERDYPHDFEVNKLHYTTSASPRVSAPQPDATTKTEPAEPDEELPLDWKNLSLKELLQRIQERNRMEYCKKIQANAKPETAEPEATKPGGAWPAHPCNPPCPYCPGGKPQCVPLPSNQPAPFCPGPSSKPQCTPPCDAPPGPCPIRKTSAVHKTPFVSFFKDLVLAMIQAEVMQVPRPRINKLLSKFLINLDVCVFAMLSSEFMPSKVDDPELIKGLLKARDYEPWAPIPSWPYPKEKKGPLTSPQKGCQIIPPPKLTPPSGENPCKNLPLPRTYHIPFSAEYAFNLVGSHEDVNHSC